MRKKQKTSKIKIDTSKLKLLAVQVPIRQIQWLHQTAKANEQKLAPFVRAIFDYLENAAPKELFSQMRQTTLKKELEVAQKAFDAAAKVKEEKERELAELAS